MNKVLKAIRRVEKVGENEENRGGFFELIELFDENGNSVIKSGTTHPESYFTFQHNNVEYLSLPNSKGIKPVYHRYLN